MKKKATYTLFYVLLISSVLSCKKSFLDVVPFGLQVATTTDDFDKLMNDPNFYFTSSSGGNETVLMGDEIAAQTGYFSNKSIFMDRLFQWQPVIYQVTDQPSPFLTLQLTQLYTLNKVISQVMNSTGGTDQQKKEIRAEAWATRAWINFELINYYAKPYLASTAATDPGFPIIDKADVTIAKYDRGTVQQMYDFIIQDLTNALTDINQKPLIVTRMSKPAVEGLLGKVYVFMGRYSDALPHFASAFNNISVNGVPVLYDYNQTFLPTGSFQPIDPVNGPSGPGNNQNDLTEAIVSKVYYNGILGFAGPIGTDGLVTTTQTTGIYEASDLRLILYSNTNVDGNPLPLGTLRKYGITYSRFGLQLPELYLLSAECKARLGDFAGAKADVETLRRNRMPTADATVPANIAGNQNSLIKFVIDERIREFALEGYRWFDMRRLSVDPLFAGQAFIHTYYNVDGTTTNYTLSQPNRLVLKVPSSIALTNPDFQNNP